MKERIEAAIRTAILGSIAAAAGVVAFAFGAISLFFWTQQRYDTIVAGGALAGLFLLVALTALLTLAIMRRRARKARKAEEAAQARAAPGWLADPANILIALQIARSIGFGRLIPIALIGAAGAAAAGLFSDRSPANGRKAKAAKSEKREAA